jgi:NitT/TauT family transport system substrate-binding protein
MQRRLIGTVLLGALALAARPPVAAQPALRTITIGVTSKTANDWALFVAEREGFFAAAGLSLDTVVIGVNSGVAQQLTGGSIDVGEVTTTQAVLAIQGGAPMACIVNQGVGAPYYLIGRKGITTIAQLKGKTISIGGPSDITRVFMDTMLERAGLKPDDYTYTYAGTGAARYAAISAGAIDATLLTPPLLFHAATEGYPVIDEVPKYFPGFPYTTWAARPAWAKDHADLVVAFVKAQLQAARWLYDPANKQKAIALLAEVTNTSLDDSSKTYDVFVTKEHFFSPAGTFTVDGFTRVLQAMAKAGMIAPPLPPAGKFYDNTYAERANAQLR